MKHELASLPVFSRAQIESVIGIADALEPTAASLVAYSEGRAVRPPLGLLTFDNGGEAHIKSGYIKGAGHFVTKIATMVRANRERGLHSSDGVMLLCSAETGFPIAVLHDRKYLTDIRTAAVGALAARLLAPEQVDTVGIFGTGGQALLQIQALALVRPFRRVLIWGRDAERAAGLAASLKGSFPDREIAVEPSEKAVCEASQVIITATAATSPLIRGEWLRPGTHITAMGADDADKCEIDPACFERARILVVDSYDLAERFGDIPNCLKRAPGLRIHVDAELGELLGGSKTVRRAPEDITISKHIGLGVEDLAVALESYRRLTA